MSTYTSNAGHVSSGAALLRARLDPRIVRYSTTAFEFKYANLRMPSVTVAEKEEILTTIASDDRDDAVSDAHADWTICRCRIHDKIECGVEGAEGCRGCGYGKHGAIAALYEGDHRACTAEVGARVLDRKLFDLLEFGVGRTPDPLKKYATGMGTSAERMGAFYCGMHLFPPEIVVRVARIIGPFPLKARLVRYAVALGRPVIPGFKLTELSSGDLHISIDGNAQVSLREALLSICRTGKVDARVGVSEREIAVVRAKQLVQDALAEVEHVVVDDDLPHDLRQVLVLGGKVTGKLLFIQLADDERSAIVGSKRMQLLKEHLRRIGCRVVGDMELIVGLASMARCYLPDGLGLVDTHKSWAMHGDNCIKAYVSEVACWANALPADVQEKYGELTRRYVDAFKEPELRAAFGVAGLISGSGAFVDVFKAFAGVLHMHYGQRILMLWLEMVLGGIHFEPRNVSGGDAGASQLFGLTSRQLAVAVRLARAGILDMEV